MGQLVKRFTESSPLASAYLQLLPLTRAVTAADYLERLAIIADTGADSLEVEMVSDSLQVVGFELYWAEFGIPCSDENAPDVGSTGRWPVLLQRGVELDPAFITSTLKGLGIVPDDAHLESFSPSLGAKQLDEQLEF